MKRMALMVVSMVVILSVNLYAQGEPKYRVVVLNFIEETNSYKSLERSLPKALESEISNSCKPLIEMLERSQMEEVLEEVEYQYDRQVLFDKTTIAKVNWKGANAVIVGKIKPQRDEIRVDVKLVEIETGRQLGQAYTIPRANELQTLSQIAGKMKELAIDLCKNISPSTPTSKAYDCKDVTTSEGVIQFYSVESMDWTNEWRGWPWAKEAFYQAKKAKSSMVLVHIPTILEKEITEKEHVFYRFGVNTDDPLYEGRIKMEQAFTIGSCWIEKSKIAGRKFTSNGIKGVNETITIYVLQK